MQFNYENENVKRNVRVMLGLLTGASVAVATYSSKYLKPVFDSTFKQFTEHLGKDTIPALNLLVEGLYVLLLSLCIYFLSHHLFKLLGERWMRRVGRLSGWWIYGFKVKHDHMMEVIEARHKREQRRRRRELGRDPLPGEIEHVEDPDGSGDKEAYVVGKFYLEHRLTGMGIRHHGQSEYLVLEEASATASTPSEHMDDDGNSHRCTIDGKEYLVRLDVRGIWEPYDIVTTDSYSSIWILYRFQWLHAATPVYYDGIMNLNDTMGKGILSGSGLLSSLSKSVRRLRLTRKSALSRWLSGGLVKAVEVLYKPRHQYRGFVQDLAHGVEFSPMFAEKAPDRISFTDDLNEVILENAAGIKRKIDRLEHKAPFKPVKKPTPVAPNISTKDEAAGAERNKEQK